MQIESQSLSESCESCREQPPTHLKMQPHDDQEGASIQIIYAVIIKHQTSRARHRPGRPQTNNDSQMSLGNGNVASQIDTHTLRHVHTHRYIHTWIYWLDRTPCGAAEEGAGGASVDHNDSPGLKLVKGGQGRARAPNAVRGATRRRRQHTALCNHLDRQHISSDRAGSMSGQGEGSEGSSRLRFRFEIDSAIRNCKLNSCCCSAMGAC